MQTEPFDLTKALNGAKVMTVSGLEVKQVILLDIENERNVLAVFKKDCMLYRPDGTCSYTPGDTHYTDLVLVIESKSIWVNVYMESDSSIYLGIKHNTKEEAINSKDPWNYITTIELPINKS